MGQIAPHFFVNGQVLNASSFTISVDAGSAVEGTDYSFSSKTRSIPVGNYSLADSIPLNFSIIDNSIPQNNRTIVLNIATTAGDVDRRDANADGIFQRTLVVIIEDDDPCKDPGIDNTLSFCAEGSTDIDLFASLGANADQGGVWSDNNTSGVILTNPSSVDFSGVAIGTYNYTYSFAQEGICSAHQATITVEIREPFPAGIDASVNVCSINGAAAVVDLIANLGGSPLSGGSWTEQTASGADITDPSSVNFAGIVAGSYTFVYTLVSEIECAGNPAFATLTVNVTQPPNAGTDNSVNECTDTPLNLFTSLGGTPDSGGIWTDLDGAGVNLTNPISVDFSAVGAGSYDFEYTVTGSAPCNSATATVTVNVDVQHDPGTNNSVSLCNDGSLLDLFGSLGGTPDPGGTWADTDASGVDLSDPAMVNFTGITSGDYDFTYTITGDGSCTDESAVVTVTVENNPDAGTDGTVNVCDGGASTVIDLVTSLGGTPDGGGTWNETSAVASGVSLADPNNVDFIGIQAGSYEFTYTVTATVPCNDASATVIVNVNQLHNVGSNTQISGCNATGTTLNLFASLQGSPDPGGSWSETSIVGSGANITDPTAVDFSGITAGDYEFTYTIAGDGVCSDQSAILFVTLNQEFDSGTDGTASICNSPNAIPVDLFDQLGGTPDTGGVWFDLDQSGGNLPNGFGDFVGITAGTYRFQYVLADPQSSCQSKSSSVTITVDQEPNAGTDAHLVVCDGGSGTVRDLQGALGGADAGGSWADLDASGVSLVDPTMVDFDGVPGGQYRYEYTLSGTGGCSNETAIVYVAVGQDANAGTDTQQTICNAIGNPSVIDLFTQLGGSPGTGGTWSFTSASTFDITDPHNVDISAANGNYVLEYTIPGDGACQTKTAVLTLDIEGVLFAGTRNTTTAVCSTENSVIDLAQMFAQSDPGGSYADVDGSGVDLSDPTAVDFSGLAAGNYDFTYTVTNTCNTDVSTNTITVVGASDAGSNGTLSICNDDTSVDLFGALGGTPEMGGYWSDNNTTNLTLGDGTAVDFSGVKKGTYKFTYHVQDNPCSPAAATVTVTVTALPFAGNDHTILLCDAGDLMVNFTSEIQINSSLTAEWTDSDNTGVDLTDPSSS